MLNPQDTIKTINSAFLRFSVDSKFFLTPSSANRFRVNGNKISAAKNNYKNSSEEVQVVNWFDSFWIYLEIRFEDQNTFISLSVFQGHENDNVKHQLFRAEWDDYNNLEEKHPQPHWHITANQAIERTFEEFAHSEDLGFVELLKEEKSKIIDINKIHFAMCGNWANDEPHVHSIDEEGKIVRWLQGLFLHLKEQLDYVT